MWKRTRECCRGPGLDLPRRREFNLDWREWCEANHEEPGTNRSFKKALERLGDLTFRATKRSVLVKGLCCRARWEQDDQPEEVNE